MMSSSRHPLGFWDEGWGRTCFYFFSHSDVSTIVGTPIAGWFVMEFPIYKWMIWGYPHLRKPPFVSKAYKISQMVKWSQLRLSRTRSWASLIPSLVFACCWTLLLNIGILVGGSKKSGTFPQKIQGCGMMAMFLLFNQIWYFWWLPCWAVMGQRIAVTVTDVDLEIYQWIKRRIKQNSSREKVDLFEMFFYLPHMLRFQNSIIG